MGGGAPEQVPESCLFPQLIYSLTQARQRDDIHVITITQVVPPTG